MAHAEPPRAQAHTAAHILSTYLAEHGHVLAPHDAVEICDALALAEVDDIKAFAKQLRDELNKYGIVIKHTNALEVLARVAGYACYMRAKRATAGPTVVNILFSTIEGDSREPRVFPSLGELVTALLSTAIGLVPARNEPAFCRIRKYASGFQVEVSQQKAPWFALQFVRFREDSLNTEDLVAMPLEDEAFRTAIRKIVGSIEQARPAALVMGGEVGETLSPYYCAAFHVTALGSRIERTVADERELFVYLDAVGCNNLSFEHGTSILYGASERFSVEPVWFDQTGQDTSVHRVDGGNTMKSVFQRYLRFRQALPGTVAQALVAVGGSKESSWHARPSFETIEKLASDQQLSIAELARKAGVAFRDIKKVQEFELADGSLVLRVAAALDVEPESLLTQNGTSIGFSAENGEQFMKMVSGAMAYELLEGESLKPEDLEEMQRLLETARDIAELSAFEDSDFGGSFSADGSLPRHEKMAQELLDDAAAAGIKLILNRHVRFMKMAERTKSGDDYLAMNVLTICAERFDMAKPAIWSPL
ncbi:glyoxalase superfamily protein [Paraburkholderia sp. EG287A]|uniref:glyoxalase superfamily protein n=1 Tax=Paraburkholderia sp. EG287A TaxID=3237012 RepID=UPI0034D22A4C